MDSLFTALIVVVALLFGLAGACFLLLGLSGIGGSARNPNAIVLGLLLLAFGIGFLMGALNLIRYVRRRRAAQKSGL